MLKHYIKTAWRNLRRDRQFTFLNLVGLSTGLACAILIYLWVNDELQVDKFHTNDAQLYQVMEKHEVNNNLLVKEKTSGLLAETLAEQMPEVAYAAPVIHYSWFPKFILSGDGTNKIKGIGQFAGEDFFNVFSYGLIHGNANQVLSDKKSIVISETLARKLFNTDDVVGKTLNWQLAHIQQPVIISGVFRQVPAASSQQFDFVLPFLAYKELAPDVGHWGNDGTNAYVVLKKGTDLAQFNKKIEGIIKTKQPKTSRTLFLKRFSDTYLHANYENGKQAGGRIQYVQLLSVIAVFILVIACINFMNLSTAKASRRLKETGVKKVVGASRRSLIFQFLGESLLMSFVALLLGLLLVGILLPPFNAITGKQIVLGFDMKMIAVMLVITIITGLLSGSYPAVYLSRFNPVAVLKGKLKNSIGEVWIRKGLVVFQFTLSVIFIVAVMVVYKQIHLVQTTNLGYNKDNVVYFEKEGKLNENLEPLIADLKKIPGAVNASSVDHLITGSYNSTGDISWEGKDPGQSLGFEIVRVNYDMIETFGIQMKEGRSFSREYGADSTRIIFNETAIAKMGLKDPVGKHVKMWGQDMEIAGVTKDFHFESLHTAVKPLYFMLLPKQTFYIMVRMQAGKEKEVLAAIKNLYAKHNPGYAFDYNFLDEKYQKLYASEQRISVLSRYFAGLTILISCLGLFGLAAFTAQRRQKEIGIRKVVGASVSNIAIMLSSDFLKLVLLSMIIAFPVAAWLMSQWLESFAYRVDIGAGIFVVAGISVFLITILTIGAQAIRAALANPVRSLRTE